MDYDHAQAARAHDRDVMFALRNAIRAAIDAQIEAESARRDSLDRMDPMSLISEGKVSGMCEALRLIDQQWRGLRGKL